MKAFIDYYEILEVRENASEEVIKMAYKALALKYHPDRSGDVKKDAHTKMQMINEAYMMLSNPEKRKQYDQQMRIRKSAYSQNYDHDDLHKNRERERMYEEAKARAEKEKYAEEIRRQEEVKRKAEEYKNKYSNEQNGAQMFEPV